MANESISVTEPRTKSINNASVREIMCAGLKVTRRPDKIRTPCLELSTSIPLGRRMEKETLTCGVHTTKAATDSLNGLEQRKRDAIKRTCVDRSMAIRESTLSNDWS